MPAAPLHRLGRLLLLLSFALCGCSLLRTLLGIGDFRLAEAIYDAGVAAACITWSLRLFLPGRHRAEVACWAIAAVLWGAGATATAFAGGRPDADAPLTLANVLLLGVGPFILLGLVLYGRGSVPRPIPLTRALDALLSALTVAAVGAALVVEDALGSSGSGAFTATVFPTTAVLIAASAVGVLALRGWASDRRFVLIATSAAAITATEILYRHAQVRGDVTQFGTLYDVGWMLAAALLAAGAWSEPGAVPTRPRRAEIVVPVLLGAAALAMLVAEGTVRRAAPLTVTLAGLAVATLLVRMALSLTANYRLLVRTQKEAVTDAVTGLGNSRSLMRDLEQVGDARETLVLLDLNGFKSYNDRFGHPAGDQLLRRIGRALRLAGGSGARTYRMGGDEFCVLLATDGAVSPAAISAAATQEGDGFTVTAAYGSVRLPEEAADGVAALRLADERMYADKHHAGGRARPVVDTLLALLRERDPELRRHADAVAQLADGTARVLGLGNAARRDLRHAAELHEIGVLTLPLQTEGSAQPYGDEEHTYVERQTVSGERVIATAPELHSVATLVRSCRERWDGGGAPDGLAGERIPLGSRIVLVCHAFDALTSGRPPAPGCPPEQAVATLRRDAGAAFDPAVVEAVAAAAMGSRSLTAASWE
ncbi:MAG: diguanylate cyclase [Conexibacter sp.]|nr:diguanylate cyclase [Conexibacter sp.]